MRKELGTSKVGSTRKDFTARMEADVRDHLVGRRDMLVGLWAGERLGLPQERRAIYAMEVMAAGLLDSEPDDVVDKISRDFTERGIHITRGEILVQISKKHRLAADMRAHVPTPCLQQPQRTTSPPARDRDS
jgi:hypothetical protein